MISIFKEILPKIIGYRLSRFGVIKAGNPFNLTFSVTNVCQSRCRTCKIWDLYNKNPEKRNEELSLDEIKKIFSSLGHVYIFNISGGEPFLRRDLPEIIRLACEYLTPGIIHIPTNAIAFELAEKRTREILEIIDEKNPSIQLTVKPSLDHIGEKHDDIRGVHGNFEKVMKLFQSLKYIQKDYSNLHVELGTVISSWNVYDINEISSFVSGLGADSYRNEIAEQRSEMFNVGENITPDGDQYEKAIRYFIMQIRGNMKKKRLFQKITNAFRLTYYTQASSILKNKRKVIPCYGGITNIHLSPYGDIWPCCTLGYDYSMGNLRNFGYDFNLLRQSERALEVIKYVKNDNCYCPLANQAYSNILMHMPSLAKTIIEMIRN